MLRGAEEAYWAHNPRVVGSKPTEAIPFARPLIGHSIHGCLLIFIPCMLIISFDFFVLGVNHQATLRPTAAIVDDKSSSKISKMLVCIRIT